MIDLDQHECVGSALEAAMQRWPNEICLIEADRERENCRLTYRDFDARGRSLARALEAHGFGSGERAAIIMSNQSKWLLSAYALFLRGGVLVPLDFKLTGGEHVQLLEHSESRVLVTEYHFWRNITRAHGFARLQLDLVLVTEAPENADLMGARRWEEFYGAGDPAIEARQRRDMACIVYSSGTGGRPKGCVLTHDNYLEQCKALTRLYKFAPGFRYLSVLPTNHAIDFMVGFFGPFVCGATVVHLRTLRPEFVRDAFPRYKITYMALVPMVLKNLERGLRQRIAALPPARRWLVQRLIRLNRALVGNRPNVKLSRFLLRPIHRAFGGHLRMLFVGGAFTEPETLEFFFDLGIPVANGYGLTEAGTVITVNDMRPFRSDSVGKPLPGTDVRIVSPDSEGIGEVAARGRTIMSFYLDDPELTSATIVDGWLMTGDLGRLDRSGHLQLFGRKKNMIVTSGGKNIYPEDIENAFVGIPVKEYCIYAADFLWPERVPASEQLVMVLRLEPGQEFTDALRDELESHNRRLPDFKRIHGFTLWNEDFPRTASMKVKREQLAQEIRSNLQRQTALVEI
ncbi:MAG: AMP-binding protein [Candidatus Latescibacterota bacterium]|nr:MAG: AMP-binding protein [Candidatus Latescibacterota bacterium]